MRGIAAREALPQDGSARKSIEQLGRVGDDSRLGFLRHVAPRGAQIGDAVVDLPGRQHSINRPQRLDFLARLRVEDLFGRDFHPRGNVRDRLFDELGSQHCLIGPPQTVRGGAVLLGRGLALLRKRIRARDTQHVAQHIRSHVRPERIAALPSGQLRHHRAQRAGHLRRCQAREQVHAELVDTRSDDDQLGIRALLLGDRGDVVPQHAFRITNVHPITLLAQKLPDQRLQQRRRLALAGAAEDQHVLEQRFLIDAQRLTEAGRGKIAANPQNPGGIAEQKTRLALEIFGRLDDLLAIRLAHQVAGLDPVRPAHVGILRLPFIRRDFLVVPVTQEHQHGQQPESHAHQRGARQKRGEIPQGTHHRLSQHYES